MVRGTLGKEERRILQGPDCMMPDGIQFSDHCI